MAARPPPPIPGAELLLIDGMGHDLPAELFDTFVEGDPTAPRTAPADTRLTASIRRSTDHCQTDSVKCLPTRGQWD